MADSMEGWGYLGSVQPLSLTFISNLIRYYDTSVFPPLSPQTAEAFTSMTLKLEHDQTRHPPPQSGRLQHWHSLLPWMREWLKGVIFSLIWVHYCNAPLSSQLLFAEWHVVRRMCYSISCSWRWVREYWLRLTTLCPAHLLPPTPPVALHHSMLRSFITFKPLVDTSIMYYNLLLDPR